MLSAARRVVRQHRDASVFRRSDPRFARALEPALAIEGFTSPVELSLLYHLALLGHGHGEVVEIGSYLGRSTVVLARAVADAGQGRVVAVDPHTGALGFGELRGTEQEFASNIAAAGLTESVELMRTTSTQAAQQWSGETVRMLFVDGWHSYEAVIEDTHAWLPFFSPDAAVVFDDYPHPGVRDAVAELKRAGILSGAQLMVGKMAVFVPKALVASLPYPPGASLLPRLGQLGFRLAFGRKAPGYDVVPPARPPEAAIRGAADAD